MDVHTSYSRYQTSSLAAEGAAPMPAKPYSLVVDSIKA